MSSLRELLAGLPPKPCFADYYQIVPLQLEKTLLRSPGRTLALRAKRSRLDREQRHARHSPRHADQALKSSL